MYYHLTCKSRTDATINNNKTLCPNSQLFIPFPTSYLFQYCAHVFNSAVGARSNKSLLNRYAIKWLVGSEANVAKGALHDGLSGIIRCLLWVRHAAINGSHILW